MNFHIRFILILLCTICFLNCTRTSDCHDINYFIEKTILSIKTKDVDSYAKLANFSLFSKICKAKSTDECKIDSATFYQFFKMDMQRFLNFNKNCIEDIKMIDYRKVKENDLKVAMEHVINLKLKNNNRYYELNLSIAEFQNCYFLVTPMDSRMIEISK